MEKEAEKEKNILFFCAMTENIKMGKEMEKEKNILFYLNGKKWNGKGYDKNCKVIYELKDGKGYIKEFYMSDKLKYEGEYIKGELNGKGKEFYFDGKIEFEGEYLNGKRWNGKGFDINNNIYKKI